LDYLANDRLKISQVGSGRTRLVIAAGPSVFRRRVVADASGNAVNAAIEDDFHHYEILLEHDGQSITSIKSRSHRTPWVTCCEAEAQLDQLLGHSLSTRPTGLPDPHFQCTHMFELAVVAIAQAARGGYRRYDVAVPLRSLTGPGSANLRRDGETLLDWTFEGDFLTAPSSFAGRNLRTLVREAERECDDDMLEAIRVLRRSIHVSSGRSVDFESFRSAADITKARGACYVFQPERVERALRNPGSRRDFSNTALEPLARFPTLPGGNR
jgi:hypothetical protein